MLRSLALFLILALAASFSLSLKSFGQEGSDSKYFLNPEKFLRKRVTQSVEMKVPEEAIKLAAHGLIVVAVVFDEDGNLSSAEVLQSPHSLITKSVLESLKKWKIVQRGDRSGLVKTVSWLTFDCFIRDGIGRIEYAAHDQDTFNQDQRYRHPYVKGMPFFYRYQ